MILNRLFGDYVLLKKIGIGGMAEIFLAHRKGIPPSHGLVAIKRIMSGRAEHPQYQRLFKSEAELTATFDHPHVVRMHSFERIEGVDCMVMEFLHGHTLEELLAAAADHKLPLAAAAWVTMRACEGLDHIHNHSTPDGRRLEIVHRDISPHNIMVTYDGQVKIFDFGIAASELFEEDHLEKSGAMAGKVGYMSPEQCRSEPIDARTDVFSMGAVLWEMTTGQRLFWQDNQFKTINAIIEGPIKLPSEVSSRYPASLETVVMKALERDRDKRTRSALALRMGINRALSVEGLSPHRRTIADLMKQLFADDLAEFNQMMASFEDGADAPRRPVIGADAGQDEIDEAAIEASIEAALAEERAKEEASAAAVLAGTMEMPTSPDISHSGAFTAIQRPGAQAPKNPQSAPRHLSGALPALPQQSFPNHHSTPGATPFPPSNTEPGVNPMPHTGVHTLPQTGADSPGVARIALLGSIFGLGALMICLAIAGYVMLIKDQNAPPSPAPIEALPEAGRLKLETSPPGARITLGGRRLSVVTPTTVPDLPFDQPVIVTLELDGFEAVQHKATLSQSDHDQTFQATLQPIKQDTQGTGGLRVTTTPRDAKVLLDGEPIAEQTPVTNMKVTAGVEHAIRIVRDGYQDEVMSFVLERGEIKDFDIELFEDDGDALAQISITSEPSNCRVTVNDVFYGTTAILNLMTPALEPLDIEVACRGLDPWREEILLQPDEERTLHAALGLAADIAVAANDDDADQPNDADAPKASDEAAAEPAAGQDPGAEANPAVAANDARDPDTAANPDDDSPAAAPPEDTLATLNVVTTPPTDVRANGKALGRAPVQGARLQPGSYTLRFTDPAQGISYARRVKLVAGQQEAMTVAIPTGLVTVRSDMDAEVTINGQRAGQTPLEGHALHAGTHKIRVFSPEKGYAREYRIRIRGGDKRAVSTRFQEVVVTRVAQKPRPKPEDLIGDTPKSDDTDPSQPQDAETPKADETAANADEQATDPQDPPTVADKGAEPTSAAPKDGVTQKKPAGNTPRKPKKPQKPNPLDDEPYPLLR